jgi:hypothetical protein
VNNQDSGCSNGTSALAPDSPAVMAHINMIQGVINRLASASASCKTWCITLVSALASLAGATRTPAILTAAVLPIVLFAYLDAMYLAQERAYRALFKKIVTKTRDSSYSRADAFEADAGSPWSHFPGALLSWSVWPVYVCLGILYGIAFCSRWLEPVPVSADQCASVTTNPTLS